MLGAEKVADLFDEIHKDNQKAIERGLQDWVSGIYTSEGENWEFYGAAVTAGVADALYTFVGGMGAGLVDLLRVGEGVKEGTAWGVAKDGLRAISIFGGVFRVARLVAAELKLGGAMTCTLSSSSKAAMLSGNTFRQSVLFDRMAALFGGRSAVMSPAFTGTATPLEMEAFFNATGVRVTKQVVTSVDDVVELAEKAKGPVVFGVRWGSGGGHTMVAYRGLLGEVRFADQAGRTVTDVAKIGLAQSTYIDAMIVHDATIVQAMRLGTVGHFLAAPLYDVNPDAMRKVEQKARAEAHHPAPRPTAPPQKVIVESMTEITICKPPEIIGERQFQQCRKFYLYKVRPGDSVRLIAKKVYKDEKYWRVIVAANGHQIGPAPTYLIIPGQELYLPAL